MGLVIRFGYCPPNPGPKAKIRNKWYREEEFEDAINDWMDNPKYGLVITNEHIEK